MIHRIELLYTPAQGTKESVLEVLDDVKGLYSKRLGHKFKGEEADLMFKLLQNVNYDNLPDAMGYGVYVYNHKDKKWENR